MDMTGNTILITGGGSGIGGGLAKAFHTAGNTVVVAGRSAEPLERLVAGHPGMTFHLVDVGDADALRTFADEMVATYPDLNVLVNNAGIMRPENLVTDPVDLSGAEEQVGINLLGPIRLGGALLPHLRKQARAAIVNVSSGLAFVPLAMVPTYCATKAAIHAYSQALRVQLRDTSVQVIEIAPPAVATNLMPNDGPGPRVMALKDFIDQTMAIMTDDPDVQEVLVDAVKMLRTAEASGRYDQVFNMLNGGAAPGS